jgi:feruloyl esterase
MMSANSFPSRRLAAFATLAALAASAWLAGQPAWGAEERSRAAPSGDVACALLSDYEIAASVIGLPSSGAVVESASYVAGDVAGNANGAHCEVRGLIKPKDPAALPIEFQVNLPEQWNGKAVHFGGGGYDGILVTGLGVGPMQPADSATPLKRGYITLGSDSGHKIGDDHWALNDEALANFGHQQLKKTHDVAVALARRRYGKPPTRFYFIGNSQGGHEALDVAARYPADYDGIVATHPAYNAPLLHLGSLHVVQAGAAGNGAGWLDPAKHALVKNLVMASCDSLDGLADQIISNLPACRAVMTMAKLRATLRCPQGKDAGDACLSDAQLAAIAAITAPWRPGVTIAGAREFGGWGMLEGADLPLGKSAIPANPPALPNDSFYALIAATTVKYVVTKDPAFDILRFEPRRYRERLQQVGTIMDVTDVDLAPFKARGGKIIMTHGTADQLIPSSNSVNYYHRQLTEFGQAGLDAFLRFYMIPGFAHGGGTFAARYDGLAQLERWVEQGVAPQDFVAVDEAAAAHGRTRPMCLYGSYPKFSGAEGASQLAAANFRCVPY